MYMCICTHTCTCHTESLDKVQPLPALMFSTLAKLVVDQLSVINNTCRQGMTGSRKTRRNFFRQ